MRKYLLYFILVILIAMIAYIMATKQTGSLSENMAYLNMDNIEAVTAVEIKTGDGEGIYLTSESKSWLLENGKPASREGIFVLFQLIERLEVKVPIASNEEISIKKQNYIREVSLFREGILEYHFLLWKDTTSGTTYISEKPNSKLYMLGLRGKDLPFIWESFSVDKNYWQSHLLIHIPLTSIHSIEVLYPNNKEQSFKIIRQNNSQLTIGNPFFTKPVESFNIQEMEDYLHYFTGIEYEKKRQSTNIKIEDLKPMFELDIVDIKLNSIHIQGYPMQILDEQGNNTNTVDMYRFLAVKDENYNDIYLVKYAYFDPILKSLNDFLAK